MSFFLKLDPRTRKPRALLRTVKANVDRWTGSEWERTELDSMELAGLGGSSDYYTIKSADVKGWQGKLPPK